MSHRDHVRNFCIIAHVDHGKSTLADRMLELTGTLTKYQMKDQVLDSMDIERERGITIKAQSVTLMYDSDDGHTYQFNIIDTPGHVDFSYEVSRSMAACEGALLVVDAAQGVEAQSVANCYTAMEQGLEVVPVLNKIDLPAAEPERVSEEIEEVIGIDATDPILVSAKTGQGVEDVLEALVENIPQPKGDPDGRLSAQSRADSSRERERGTRVQPDGDHHERRRGDHRVEPRLPRCTCCLRLSHQPGDDPCRG